MATEMERYRGLALLVTKIYGATFLALSLGYGISGVATLLLEPQWHSTAFGYFATAGAHLAAGSLIIGLCGPIARFATKPAS